MTIIHILYIDNRDILLLALTLVYSQKVSRFQSGFKRQRDLTGDGNSVRYRFRGHPSSPYGLLNFNKAEANLIYSIVFEYADKSLSSACLLSTRTGTQRSQ